MLSLMTATSCLRFLSSVTLIVALLFYNYLAYLVATDGVLTMFDVVAHVCCVGPGLKCSVSLCLNFPLSIIFRQRDHKATPSNLFQPLTLLGRTPLPSGWRYGCIFFHHYDPLLYLRLSFCLFLPFCICIELLCFFSNSAGSDVHFQDVVFSFFSSFNIS